MDKIYVVMKCECDIWDEYQPDYPIGFIKNETNAKNMVEELNNKVGNSFRHYYREISEIK